MSTIQEELIEALKNNPNIELQTLWRDKQAVWQDYLKQIKGSASDRRDTFIELAEQIKRALSIPLEAATLDLSIKTGKFITELEDTFKHIEPEGPRVVRELNSLLAQVKKAVRLINEGHDSTEKALEHSFKQMLEALDVVGKLTPELQAQFDYLYPEEPHE